MVTLKPYSKDRLPIPRNSPLRGVLFVIVAAWFIIPFGGSALFADQFFDSDLGWVFIVGFFAWFFGIFAMLWLGNALVRGFMRRMVGEITLEASSFTIQRGHPLRVRLHQPGNPNRSLNSVTLQLVKHEWVEYSCGTDTCTDTHDVVVDSRDFKPKQGADYEVTFAVPADAMHTFHASKNRIQWFVTIRLDIPTWADYYERYEVRCLAQGGQIA